jgi:hypothetical protein
MAFHAIRVSILNMKNINVVHLLFIAWVVLLAHYPILVILGFLFFLAFVEATRRHQVVTSLRGPM